MAVMVSVAIALIIDLSLWMYSSRMLPEQVRPPRNYLRFLQDRAGIVACAMAAIAFVAIPSSKPLILRVVFSSVVLWGYLILTWRYLRQN